MRVEENLWLWSSRLKTALRWADIFMVLPQVDGADVSLDSRSSAQHLAAVLPQALEHHLHGVLQEKRRKRQCCQDKCRRYYVGLTPGHWSDKSQSDQRV